jgi:hypothetical protein
MHMKLFAQSAVPNAECLLLPRKQTLNRFFLPRLFFYELENMQIVFMYKYSQMFHKNNFD